MVLIRMIEHIVMKETLTVLLNQLGSALQEHSTRDLSSTFSQDIEIIHAQHEYQWSRICIVSGFDNSIWYIFCMSLIYAFNLYVLESKNIPRRCNKF